MKRRAFTVGGSMSCRIGWVAVLVACSSVDVGERPLARHVGAQMELDIAPVLTLATTLSEGIVAYGTAAARLPGT